MDSRIFLSECVIALEIAGILGVVYHFKRTVSPDIEFIVGFYKIKLIL